MTGSDRQLERDWAAILDDPFGRRIFPKIVEAFRWLIFLGFIGSAILAFTTLSGCSTAQVAAFEPKLAGACYDALAVANIAGLVPGVGAIVPYITAGCATAEGAARLAADPSSVQWVAEQIGKVKALARAVGLRL